MGKGTAAICLALAAISACAIREANAAVAAWSTGCDPANIGKICTMYAQVSDPPAQYVTWTKLGADRNEVSLISNTEVPWLGQTIKKRGLWRSGVRGITVTSMSSEGVATSMLIFKVTPRTGGRYRCDFHLGGVMTEYRVDIDGTRGKGNVKR